MSVPAPSLFRLRNRKLKMDIEQRKIELNYEVGDSVKIKHGPLENFIGVVDEINLEKKNQSYCINV